MDEARLEDKINELVKEFGETADPQRSKLGKTCRASTGQPAAA